LGYYAGEIDGIYGPQLRTGVRWFQQKYGLSVTGAVDDKTLQAILWAYAELKIPKSAPPKQPVPTEPPSPPADQLSSDENRMLELVNQERMRRGLPALIADQALSKVAEEKSRDMIASRYFSHQSPSYGSPFEMMKQFGISYRSAGENIACNQT